MVKPSVALLSVLLAVMVLAGPVAADPGDDPQPQGNDADGHQGDNGNHGDGNDGQGTGPDGSDDGDDADASSSDSTDGDASGSDGNTSSASAAPSSDAAAASAHTRVCRIFIDYIGDPRVSPTRWIIPDPDGCLRRTVDRVVGNQVSMIRSKIPLV
jgi:hypothetical protein